jgi:hypothetical protein
VDQAATVVLDEGAVGQRRLSWAGPSLFDPVTRLSAVIVVAARADRADRDYAAAAARTPGTSTRMPGPMVLAMVSDLMY